mgnify:CR=1 FL=1
MNKKMIVTALCISAMTPMMAQNITGKVVDVKGESLAFCQCRAFEPTRLCFRQGSSEWK